MPAFEPKETEWSIDLEDGFWIAVRMVRFRNLILDFSVVLIHENECITRFDTAHDFAHRDVIGLKKGLIEKEECPKVLYKEAFEYAIRDLKKRYKQYHHFYTSH